MANPVAILISDVHYNVQTLPLADAATRMAISRANELCVPLIVAGDLHDTKANIRAECIDAMLKTFSLLKSRNTYILRGNHDAYNEKSEQHALTFLKGVATIVDTPAPYTLDYLTDMMGVYLIPYQHDPEALRAYLKTIPKCSTLIMHQGLTGADSGDYIQDKSAINPEDVADFRVIGGHYHNRQDIKTGRPRRGAVGLFSYIGNPYSLSFGEAGHPSKGFQILMDDGTLEFVPTNLRKHIIVDINIEAGFPFEGSNLGSHFDSYPGDLIWIKLTGPTDKLALWPKERVAQQLSMVGAFRFETIATDTVADASIIQQAQPQNELFDSIIDSLTNTENDRKARLKALWKDLTGEE